MRHEPLALPGGGLLSFLGVLLDSPGPVTDTPKGALMKLKVKVDVGNGEAYLAVIDPSTGEHRKSATVKPGQELELTLPDVHDEGGIEFGDVVVSDKPADEQPADTPEPDAPPAEEKPEDAQPQEAGEIPAGLAIGRVVIYRSKTGNYDLPAIVNCTTATLDPEGVKLRHVPQLDYLDCVHLTVFTCGAAGGSYQEFNIPMSGFSPATATDGDEPQPGTWRWPERV